jgi:putative oxidoreductase
MHEEHTAVEILAHVMIASLFLYRGIGAIGRFGHHRARLASRSVPVPGLVLAAGLGMMLAGGGLVALGLFSSLGALVLILFTVAASVLYHDFWAIQDPEQRRRQATSFSYNVAVMGGLVLVAV